MKGNSKVKPDLTLFVRLKSLSCAMLRDGEGNCTVYSPACAVDTDFRRWSMASAGTEIAAHRAAGDTP